MDFLARPKDILMGRTRTFSRSECLTISSASALGGKLGGVRESIAIDQRSDFRRDRQESGAGSGHAYCDGRKITEQLQFFLDGRHHAYICSTKWVFDLSGSGIRGSSGHLYTQSRTHYTRITINWCLLEDDSLREVRGTLAQSRRVKRQW